MSKNILQFFSNGGSLWDNVYTYPDFLTAGIRSDISMIFLTSYGLRNLQDRIDIISKATDKTEAQAVQMLVYALTIEKSYKWKTLLETENYEYNPIENYDRNEAEEITRNKGAQNNSTQYGATSVTNSQTAHTNTNTAGQHTDTTTEQAHTDTTSDTVSAENSTTYQPDTQSQTQYGNTSSSTAFGSQTSTTEYGATSETSAAQSHTDSFSEGAREDTEERAVRVHGNIGVMSTQDMIGQQRNIADFSALHEIARDILIEITKGVL